MDKDAFLQQGRDYEEMGKDALNAFLKIGQTLHMTHPFPAVRALELEAWSRSEDYARILSGQYERVPETTFSPDSEAFDDTPPDSSRKCPACKTAIHYRGFVFCPECGANL